MSNERDESLLTPIGSIRCPSGRLTICDWVLTGDWSRTPITNRSDDGPVVAILEHPRAPTAAAVVHGFRPDVAYPVTVDVVPDDQLKGSLRRLLIEVRKGTAASREEVGMVPLHHGRMVAVDASVDLDWDVDQSRDGLADIAFWGLYGKDVAMKFGAPEMDQPRGGCFGWRDVPLDEAARVSRTLEAAAPQGLVVDFRPHTEQWHYLEALRRSPVSAIEIASGEARLVMFHVNTGYGAVLVSAERDAAGTLLRIVVDTDCPPRD